MNDSTGGWEGWQWWFVIFLPAQTEIKHPSLRFDTQKSCFDCCYQIKSPQHKHFKSFPKLGQFLHFQIGRERKSNLGWWEWRIWNLKMAVYCLNQWQGSWSSVFAVEHQPFGRNGSWAQLSQRHRREGPRCAENNQKWIPNSSKFMQFLGLDFGATALWFTFFKVLVHNVFSLHTFLLTLCSKWVLKWVYGNCSP